MADTLDDASYNWDDKVAANVVTYANIREVQMQTAAALDGFHRERLQP